MGGEEGKVQAGMGGEEWGRGGQGRAQRYTGSSCGPLRALRGQKEREPLTAFFSMVASRRMMASSCSCTRENSTSTCEGRGEGAQGVWEGAKGVWEESAVVVKMQGGEEGSRAWKQVSGSFFHGLS